MSTLQNLFSDARLFALFARERYLCRWWTLLGIGIFACRLQRAR
jgi:hypothetical protein